MEVKGTIRAAAAVRDAVSGIRDGLLVDAVAATMRGTAALSPGRQGANSDLQELGHDATPSVGPQHLSYSRSYHRMRYGKVLFDFEYFRRAGQHALGIAMPRRGYVAPGKRKGGGTKPSLEVGYRLIALVLVIAALSFQILSRQ
jgi:hypothetical protein